MSQLSAKQLAVGSCPQCNRYPTWFNDVPLRAFCWGTDAKPHDETSCVVSGKAQPYGVVKKSSWKDSKGKTISPSISQQIIASYPQGLCPDCGWKIRFNVTEGQACYNCGHVFSLPQANS